jgi:hypothetical protein
MLTHAESARQPAQETEWAKSRSHNGSGGRSNGTEDVEPGQDDTMSDIEKHDDDRPEHERDRRQPGLPDVVAAFIAHRSANMATALIAAGMAAA